MRLLNVPCIIITSSYHFLSPRFKHALATLFWVVTPCSDVVGYLRFGGPCCLHLQGEVK
jgi:hypothetical protein